MMPLAAAIASELPMSGQGLEAAEVAGVVGGESVFPDADGEDAGAHGAEAEGLRRHAFIENGVGRQGAEVADFYAVPVDLIAVVDGGNEEGDVWRCAGGGGDVDGAAIPGKAGVAGMGLRAPGFVGGELLPSGVVEGGVGPGGVVAEMELPGAVDGGGAFAEGIDD